MNKLVFRGGGLNGSSMLAAVAKANYPRSKDNILAGATWPFVTLTLNEQSVDFSMVYIKRSVTPEDVTKVTVNKLGYVFFRLHDEAKDFGFATPRIGTLVGELRKRGYRMDATCEQNMLIARVFILSWIGLCAAIFVLVTVMGILKPNGV